MGLKKDLQPIKRARELIQFPASPSSAGLIHDQNVPSVKSVNQCWPGAEHSEAEGTVETSAHHILYWFYYNVLLVRNKSTDTNLLICGAVVVEELRLSFLVEEGVRWTLEGFGGGRMEQCEVLDRFNLTQKTRTPHICVCV